MVIQILKFSQKASTIKRTNTSTTSIKTVKMPTTPTRFIRQTRTIKLGLDHTTSKVINMIIMMKKMDRSIKPKRNSKMKSPMTIW
jgi:hypothetical protein